VDTLPKHYPAVSTQPRQRRPTDLQMHLLATTLDGFKQVFGVRPSACREIYEDGELVAVECTGEVDV
jgi:hypothetical protein